MIQVGQMLSQVQVHKKRSMNISYRYFFCIPMPLTIAPRRILSPRCCINIAMFHSIPFQPISFLPNPFQSLIFFELLLFAQPQVSKYKVRAAMEVPVGMWAADRHIVDSRYSQQLYSVNQQNWVRFLLVTTFLSPDQYITQFCVCFFCQKKHKNVKKWHQIYHPKDTGLQYESPGE